MPIHLQCVALVLAMCVLPVSGQTSREYRLKYGAPDVERFMIRPGVGATIRYGANGHPCEIVIEPIHSLLTGSTSEEVISSEDATTLTDELVPIGERGSLIKEISFGGPCNGVKSYEYDRVFISLNGQCVADGSYKVRSVSIRWKAGCQ